MDKDEADKLHDAVSLLWEKLREDSDINSLHEEMNKIADRRTYLGKMMNTHELGCPKCTTRQVQLVGYANITPAKWKCRHCKHEFEWEPDNT